MNCRFLATVVAALAMSCSTTILSSWKKPGADLGSLKNIVVVAKIKEPGMRRAAEERISASLMPPRHGTPSYLLVPEGADDDDTLRTRILEGGYDGAIVMRVAAVDKETEWVPGGWSGPVYGYGGWAAYDPGYMTTNTYVRVETNIYTVKDQGLVWSATSRTSNPSNIDTLIDETVEAVRGELERTTPKPTPVSRR